MLIGTYEKAGVPWAPRETPWNFTHELLPPDLDRIAPSLEVGFAHFPALENAGIKRVVNGPFTFSPDGNPLIGPVRGLSNYWVACGVMAGFSQGGGVGLALANWMVHGDPGFEVWAMDVARFGDWSTMAYTNAKVRENYSRRFSIRFPNEELTAARAVRTTPVYDLMRAQRAVFGAAFGLEHALWFAPQGCEPIEDVTFRRSNAHGPVGEECAAVRNAVGLLEIATFAKYEVSGAGAAAWLDYLLANRLPREGRLSLTPMLNHNGKLIGDFTVANAGGNHYFLFGSGVAEEYHLRWFASQRPASDVALRSLRTELLGFAIAGPRARDLLATLCADDVSNAALPFLSFRNTEVATVPAYIGRISFTGELGYEIWVPADCQRTLYRALVEAGGEFGLRHFGAHALHSLRLEKSFGNWAREYRPIYSPSEAGLDRFVDLAKGDFIGRAAAQRERDAGPKRRLVTLGVDAADADAIGDEPVWHDDRVVGWVTSGGYGHCVGKSIALAYVPAALAQIGTGSGWRFSANAARQTSRRARCMTPRAVGCGSSEVKRQTVSVTLRSSVLAAFGTVKHYPRTEVVTELLEPMRDAGGHKQHIARNKGTTLAAVEKYPAALRDDIDLISRVRRLRIASARRVELRQQRAVLEQRHRPQPAGDLFNFSERGGNADVRCACFADFLSHHPTPRCAFQGATMRTLTRTLRRTCWPVLPRASASYSNSSSPT